MRYLVNDGCDFIGGNLAAEVLRRGEELFVLDNFYRFGSDANFQWLRSKGDFRFCPADTRNTNDVKTIIKKVKPNYIFHLAGQVAMITPVSNPRLNFEINALEMFNVLDTVHKYLPNSIILFSSTNKVYGDFENFHFREEEKRYVYGEYPLGLPESIILDFHSPYGCSRGVAGQYMLDFDHIYGLETIVFRHSSIYGSNQHATYDQGWIGWFCRKALEIRKGILRESSTISGNGKQVRDVLHEQDVISLHFKSKDVEAAYGRAFNVGGEVENSLSLLKLSEIFEQKLDIKVNYRGIDWRESNRKVFIADIKKAVDIMDWTPEVSKEAGLGRMLNWLQK